MHPLLALFIGVAVLCVFGGLLLTIIIVMKLPRLPAEIDSRNEVRRFFIQNSVLKLYIYVKGKINGKSLLVNSRESIDRLMLPKPSIVPGSKVKSSVRIFDGVRVRFYEPITRAREEKLSGFIFIHGGGFVGGSPESYDPIPRKIAEVTEGVVISIDYRLAPENPFPAGFDDCMTATKHFFKNSAEFGVDPTRIAIGGDSAGGNLTAGVVQELFYNSDNNEGFKPKLQILLYPILQMLDLQTPSYQQHKATFGANGGFVPTNSVAWLVPRYLYGHKDESLRKGVLSGSLRAAAVNDSTFLASATNHDLIPKELKSGSWYTPSQTGSSTTTDPAGKELWQKFKPHVMDNRIMPLYKEDLSGLPPAYIVTCGFDVLRDDGVMYAERLRRAGVKARLENYPGGIHGHMWFPQYKWGREARKKLYTYLTENL